eukprot:1446461-Alexandrium_andersonii.AAC.4
MYEVIVGVLSMVLSMLPLQRFCPMPTLACLSTQRLMHPSWHRSPRELWAFCVWARFARVACCEPLATAKVNFHGLVGGHHRHIRGRRLPPLLVRPVGRLPGAGRLPHRGGGPAVGGAGAPGAGLAGAGLTDGVPSARRRPLATMPKQPTAQLSAVSCARVVDALRPNPVSCSWWARCLVSRTRGTSSRGRSPFSGPPTPCGHVPSSAQRRFPQSLPRWGSFRGVGVATRGLVAGVLSRSVAVGVLFSEPPRLGDHAQAARNTDFCGLSRSGVLAAPLFPVPLVAWDAWLCQGPLETSRKPCLASRAAPSGVCGGSSRSEALAPLPGGGKPFHWPRTALHVQAGSPLEDSDLARSRSLRSSLHHLSPASRCIPETELDSVNCRRCALNGWCGYTPERFRITDNEQDVPSHRFQSFRGTDRDRLGRLRQAWIAVACVFPTWPDLALPRAYLTWPGVTLLGLAVRFVAVACLARLASSWLSFFWSC